MPKILRNLAASALASGFACTPSCWAQQASNKELRLVWLVSTGGTIAGTGASSTSVAAYKGGTILGEDLVKFHKVLGEREQPLGRQHYRRRRGFAPDQVGALLGDHHGC
jgi:hypothetical protein